MTFNNRIESRVYKGPKDSQILLISLAGSRSSSVISRFNGYKLDVKLLGWGKL